MMASIGTGMNRELQVGLVLYLKMSEGAGSILHDMSGYRNNGAILGPAWASGYKGSGLDFEAGDSNYVLIPDSTSLSITGDITLVFAIKPESFPDANCFLNHKEDGWFTSEGNVLISNTGFVRFHRGNNVDAEDSVETAAGLISLGTWAHVVATAEGTVGKIYINGILRATDDLLVAPVNSNSGLYLGVAGPNSGLRWYFDGIMDEVREYNRALSGREVYQLFLERGFE